jgi:hypothetical protein
MVLRKMITSITITLAGFMIANSCAVCAQEAERASGYKRPVKSRAISGNLTESFYPIGWSRDGRFAYIVEPADIACDCYFANLVIKDLKTDTVLWDFDYRSTAFYEKDNTPKSLLAFWRYNQRLFSKKLREHKIRQTTGIRLESLPIIFKGDELTATLSVERDLSREGEPPIVSAIRLLMISKRKGSKIVYENRDLTDSDGDVLDVRLLGYLKSPFEERVALVLEEVHRGFEFSQVVKANLIGSDLFSGFK